MGLRKMNHSKLLTEDNYLKSNQLSNHINGSVEKFKLNRFAIYILFNTNDFLQENHLGGNRYGSRCTEDDNSFFLSFQSELKLFGFSVQTTQFSENSILPQLDPPFLKSFFLFLKILHDPPRSSRQYSEPVSSWIQYHTGW